MTHRLRGRQAVYLCRVPDDFRPQRLWHYPDRILGATLHAKNLRPADAAGFCRLHNKQQLEAFQRGEPIATWAIYSRHLRPSWRGRKQGTAHGGAA